MFFEERTCGKIDYLIRYPDNYKKGEKYPVILHLHGAGSRHNDIKLHYKNPFFSFIDVHKVFPFIIVSPLCKENETWNDVFESLKELVKLTYEEEFTDKSSFYATGCSMGGYGTWAISMSLPEYFSAIMPLCGGGMYWNAGRLKDVPVWAFHGAKDGLVKLSESQNMVDAVNEKGGKAILTIYPNNTHDVWTDTYKNYEVFKWLLKNKKD